MTPDTLISVGRIVKSRGLKGEVVVFPFSDEPERFKHFGEVVSTAIDGTQTVRKLTLVRTLRRKGRVEVHLRFEGIDSRDQADALKGHELSVPREQLPLQDNEYFLFDLQGLAVTTPAGEVVGHVRDIRRLPGQDLIVVVSQDGRESLIPDVPEFIDKSSIDKGNLVVKPIEGLLAEL